LRKREIESVDLLGKFVTPPRTRAMGKVTGGKGQPKAGAKKKNQTEKHLVSRRVRPIWAVQTRKGGGGGAIT